MRKIIKWAGLVIAVAVLVSLFFYVKDKKARPALSSDELLKQALDALRNQHDYSKAVMLSRMVLKQSPQYADAYTIMGRAYMLAGNNDSARVNLQKAVQKDPAATDALSYLVQVSMQQKDTVAAINYLTMYKDLLPDDREKWLSGYGLLLETGEYSKADQWYTAYIKKYDQDSIASIAFDHWFEKGHSQMRDGSYIPAIMSYRRAIRYHPNDTAVLQQLVNATVATGYTHEALMYNNRLLQQYPQHPVFLSNASVIWQKEGDLTKAILYAELAQQQKPDDAGRRKVLADLYVQAAKDADLTERTIYAEKAIRLSPQQKQAWVYLSNGYIEQRLYDKALETVENAMRYFPGDAELIDKKTGILYESGEYRAALAYMDAVVKNNPSVRIMRAYDEVALKAAMLEIAAGQWTTAETILQKGVTHNPRNRSLLEQLVTVYTSQKKNREALETINRLIVLDASNDGYRFRKAGLLEAGQQYEEAAEVTVALYRKNPADEKYRVALRDQLLGAQKKALNRSDWNASLQFYQAVARIGAPPYDALRYALSAYSAAKDTVSVFRITDTALQYFPADSFFLVKRTVTLSAAGNHPEALQATRELLNRFPSDTALQLVYLEQLNTAGKYYAINNRGQEAIATFLTVEQIAPRDTFALMNLSAIYFVRRQYDSSIYYADKGLDADSNNTYLWMKKAAAYEQLKQYRAAYSSASHVLQWQPTRANREYVAYLENKSLMNQLGVSHLRSFFSAAGQFASVTGIQYMRRVNKGSVTTQLNYGDRLPGTSLQAGISVYYNHDSLYYSNLFVYGSSGKAFPYWQAGYSLFRNFKKGWETEAGVRYIGFDSINNYTVTAAVGKYIGNNWLNLRAYATYNTQEWFQSYQLTARKYFNDKNDYLSLIAGLGNVPDDQSLNNNLNNFSGLTTRSIGAGFQKTIRYRTSLQFFFNYSNLQVSAAKRISQYDIYLTLLRNF